ncbi:MAG: TonB-dependent receptor [Prevotellaceae bacterium]|jgi:iron complex outermembrane receptor protein|nr:TonB-dependent receptor [Prevotellaceae bacterium]
MKKSSLLLALCLGVAVAAGFAQELDSAVQVYSLDDVTVTGSAASARQKLQPLTVVHAPKSYVLENRSSSLMTSLEKLPGVSAFQVGQGFSKPVIRGLGFNRLVVAENGVKQQEQQWGADHGLEVDQYGVEQVEIVKGPASLQYGAEAIAGVVAITSHAWRSSDGLTGAVLLNGNSGNRLLGGSGNIHYQKNAKFVEARATYQNFESYRIPAESFTYLGYTYPIRNGVLKNTAGREANVSLQAGVRTGAYEAAVLLSNVHAKTGFFAGASGLPFLINMEDSGSYRSIGMPYHNSDHLKAIVNQIFTLDSRSKLILDMSYQHNLRQEYSAPHTHGFGALPEGNLELEMALQTASLNAAWEVRYPTGSTLRAGLNAEYQHNRVGGYMFLLPEFEQLAVGAFAVGRRCFSETITATAGLRYDGGGMHVRPYEGREGYFSVPELQKRDGSASFMVGIACQPQPAWDLKANIGKSFRLPCVSEYASNGISHHMMRYELGDSALKAETAYQLDLHADFKGRWSDAFISSLMASVSVFGCYSPCFIFLNPTGEFSPLPEAGQTYRYVQSEASRLGGEVEAAADFARIFRVAAAAEYVRTVDLESGFPVAFTPPLSLTAEASVRWSKLLLFVDSRMAITHRYAAPQRRVARNELKTPGYSLLDASLTLGVPARLDNRCVVQLVLQVQNIFNTKYYKHLSFYRRLNLPEAGRNFLLSVQIPINT